MKCTASRPANRFNFRTMEHPDAKWVKLHPYDHQYTWKECPHCGCVIGELKRRSKRKEKAEHEPQQERKASHA